MKLNSIQMISAGKYLHSYQLEYEKDDHGYKNYEMVSRNIIHSKDDIGKTPSGVALIITVNGKFLLLQEFRMAVNHVVYNLCEGMLEEDETPVECAIRELKEETGLDIIKIKCQLFPCYPAPAFSDVSHYLIFAEAEGELIVPDNSDEVIIPCLYGKEEIEELLKTERFSATAQLAAYYFTKLNI